MTPLEGCHSDFTGHEPRGRTTEAWFQDGYNECFDGLGVLQRTPRMVKVKTAWLPRACGIKKQPGFEDPGCRGCARYPKESA
jgi:hypothetical protein